MLKMDFMPSIPEKAKKKIKTRHMVHQSVDMPDILKKLNRQASFCKSEARRLN